MSAIDDFLAWLRSWYNAETVFSRPHTTTTLPDTGVGQSQRIGETGGAGGSALINRVAYYPGSSQYQAVVTSPATVSQIISPTAAIQATVNGVPAGVPASPPQLPGSDPFSVAANAGIRVGYAAATGQQISTGLAPLQSVQEAIEDVTFNWQNIMAVVLGAVLIVVAIIYLSKEDVAKLAGTAVKAVL